jgi:hypothetical protein
MRDYSKTAPTFWTGETGRKIRAAGRDAQVIAFYLFTCPNSNWIGLYYLPLPTLCHEVGISTQGAMKALRSLQDIDYSYYDEGAEIVWVPGTARYQVGESLKAEDNRIKGIVKDLQQYAKSMFCKDFYDRYAALYHLPMIEMPSKPLASPLQAPSKPVTEAVIGTVTEAVIGTVTEEKIAQNGKAPSAPPPAEKFTELPCKGKRKVFLVSKAYIEEMKPLYPGVDIERETLLAKGWLLNNPKRGKTHDGMTGYLGRWFAKAQNSGNGNHQKDLQLSPAQKREQAARDTIKKIQEEQDARKTES